MTNNEVKYLKDGISNLSSGDYYDEVYHWYSRVVDLLRGFGITDVDDYPQIYNDEGRQVSKFTDPNTLKCYCVFWTYYRMPSGRWEIVCYLT